MSKNALGRKLMFSAQRLGVDGVQRLFVTRCARRNLARTDANLRWGWSQTFRGALNKLGPDPVGWVQISSGNHPLNHSGRLPA